MKLKRNIDKVNNLLGSQLSMHLDFIRGIAAVLVLISHIRNAFFVAYDDVRNQNMIQFILFSITGIGHQAVIIFFVLSGFFISNSVLKSLYRHQFTWKNYLVNRLTRLYIVLIPALLIGGIVDLVGKTFLNYNFLDYSLNARLNIKTFLINLFFLQKGIPETFGTNGPLWSLNYEFWYYILFPMSLFVIISGVSKKVKGLYLVLIIAIFALLGMKISLYYIIWLLGALLLILPAVPLKNKALKIISVVGSFLVFLISLMLGRKGIFGYEFLDDMIVAIPFTFFLYCLIHYGEHMKEKNKWVNAYNHFSKNISGFSYTLYLIHYPIVTFIFACYHSIGGQRMQPSPSLYFAAIVLTIWLMILAFFISLITEEKTSNVKKWMRSLLN